MHGPLNVNCTYGFKLPAVRISINIKWCMSDMVSQCTLLLPQKDYIEWKISTNNIPFLCIIVIILYRRHSRSLSGWKYTSRRWCWRGGMERWGCVCRRYLLLLQHWQAVTQTIYCCLRSSLQQQHCFINVPDAWTWIKTQIMPRHITAALLKRQVTGKYTYMSTCIALRLLFSVNDAIYTVIICTLHLYVAHD